MSAEELAALRAGRAVDAQPAPRVARWFGVPVSERRGPQRRCASRARSIGRGTPLRVEDAKVVDRRQRGGGRAGAQSRRRASADRRHAGVQRARPDAICGGGALAIVPVRPADGATWSAFDLSFPIIRHVDADLRISAPKVALKGYGLGRGAATITVRSGKLLADIAELELLLRQGRARRSPPIANEIVPRYTLRGKVENFEAGPAGAALFGAAVLTGRSTLALDIDGCRADAGRGRCAGCRARQPSPWPKAAGWPSTSRPCAPRPRPAVRRAGGCWPRARPVSSSRGPRAHSRRRAASPRRCKPAPAPRALPPPGAWTWPSARSTCTCP